MELLANALQIGLNAGFTACEAFAVKQRRREYGWTPEARSWHDDESQWLGGRLFRDSGEPPGFLLSRPDLRLLRRTTSSLQANVAVDRRRNWAERLPERAPPPRRLLVADPDFERVDDDWVNEEFERLRSALAGFPGLHLLRFTFARVMRRVYLANSRGFAAKYRKSVFQWESLLQRGEDRIEISESRVRPAPFVAERAVARASNLLGAMTGVEVPPPRRMVFAPEAAMVLLRASADAWRLDRTWWRGRQAVAAAAVTLVDDPGLDEQPGSVPFDDEGIAGAGTTIVSKGVFLEAISDLRSSGARGRTSTGNGFRDDRSVATRPRFSNLFIRPTSFALSRLLDEAGRAVLVTWLRLCGRDAGGADIFQAYGYEVVGSEAGRPVRFRLRTTPRSFWVHVAKVSKELRFHLQAGGNVGSPYLLVEAAAPRAGLAML